MKTHKYILFILLPLMLASCMKGVPLNAPKEELFSQLEKEGPEVEGVEGTLLKSAKDADKRGEYDKSVSIYKQLMSIDKNNQSYILGTADSYRRIGEVEFAEKHYNEVLEKDPENLDALEGKGLVKLYMGEFDRAGDLLKKVFDKDKKRWRSMNGLAILLVERGLPDEAIAYFKEALKHSDNHAPILNNIGLTYAINDDPQNAITWLTRGVEKAEPKSPMKKNIELNLALVMGIYGDMETAEKLLKQHLPKAAVANNLGLYAYLANNEELAKGYLNTALANSPYYYKRAWENLNAVTKQSKGSGKSKSSPSTEKVFKVQ